MYILDKYQGMWLMDMYAPAYMPVGLLAGRDHRF